jgi:hypothetical protein
MRYLKFIPLFFTLSLFAQVETQFEAILDGSLSFFRPNWNQEGEFFYSLIEIQPSESGLYDILNPSSNLTLTNDPYVYLYEESFDPQNPSINLIAQDDDSGGGLLFRLNDIEMFNTITYFMVATSYQPSATGTFDIIVSGVGSVEYGGSVTNPTIPEPRVMAFILGILTVLYVFIRRSNRDTQL